jgi:hypothetical protein
MMAPQMKVTANMIYSNVPISSDTSKHFDWYLTKDMYDVGFQFVYRIY